MCNHMQPSQGQSTSYCVRQVKGSFANNDSTSSAAYVATPATQAPVLATRQVSVIVSFYPWQSSVVTLSLSLCSFKTPTRRGKGKARKGKREESKKRIPWCEPMARSPERAPACSPTPVSIFIPQWPVVRYFGEVLTIPDESPVVR